MRAPGSAVRSDIRPAAQKVVVNASQLGSRRMVRHIAADLPDGHIEIEQQRALDVVANHTLDPEERRYTPATSYRADVMQAGRRIKNHVTGRQLDVVHAVCVFDKQFTAVVFLERGQKERRREIGANTVWRACDLADRIIDMVAERLAHLVTVKQWRKNLEGQRRRHEQR